MLADAAPRARALRAGAARPARVRPPWARSPGDTPARRVTPRGVSSARSRDPRSDPVPWSEEPIMRFIAPSSLLCSPSRALGCTAEAPDRERRRGPDARGRVSAGGATRHTPPTRVRVHASGTSRPLMAAAPCVVTGGERRGVQASRDVPPARPARRPEGTRSSRKVSCSRSRRPRPRGLRSHPPRRRARARRGWSRCLRGSSWDGRAGRDPRRARGTRQCRGDRARGPARGIGSSRHGSSLCSHRHAGARTLKIFRTPAELDATRSGTEEEGVAWAANTRARGRLPHVTGRARASTSEDS